MKVWKAHRTAECAALPEHMHYSDRYEGYQDTTHHKMSDYGGGWIFLNETGRSTTDLKDPSEIQPEGYFLPSYNHVESLGADLTS